MAQEPAEHPGRRRGRPGPAERPGEVVAGLRLQVARHPLQAVLGDGLVDERQNYRDEVLQDIARSASYSQQLTGPLVVVPYTRTIRSWRLDKTSQQRVLQEREVRGRLYFLPEVFSLDGQMRTELRHRGIYEARLYHVDGQVSGSFVLPAHYGVTSDLDSYRFDDPLLAVGISDVRGIENAP